jgi:hypothetical protein
MIPLPIKVFVAALVLILTLWLTGCTAMVPLGRDARLGYMALECRYLPPIGGNAEIGTRNAER